MALLGSVVDMFRRRSRIARVGQYGVIAIFVVACGGPRRTETTTTPKIAEPTTPLPPEPSAGSASEPKTLELLQPQRTEEVSASMRVHLIDVGQGAATLFEFSCGAILVDTGGESNKKFNSNERLMAYLEAFFKRRSDLNGTLDLLLITHPHIDHARGAKSVWEAYKVKNVVTDGLTTGSGGVQQANLIKWAKAAKIGVEAIKAKAIPVYRSALCAGNRPAIGGWNSRSRSRSPQEPTKQSLFREAVRGIGRQRPVHTPLSR